MSDDKQPTEAKILALKELAARAADLRAQGRTIVHCHGVFDLVHPGHIRHLQAARREGDVLVVSVTADQFVDKGPGRPVFDERLRAETLAALECVDYVAISERPSAVDMIRLLRPHVYVKGSDYVQAETDPTGMIDEERKAVVGGGGRIHFTDEMTFSSSYLINRHFSPFDPDVERWLAAFRTRYAADEVLEYLERMSSLKVLVVGEAIIDEYVFCDGLGKSTKDPILAFQYRSTEAYAGGSLAVANHVAGFCGEVGLVTTLGDTERREDFVRAGLRPNVTPRFVTRPDAPTIHKRRFVDTHTDARMFELYLLHDAPLEGAAQDHLVRTLAETAGAYDVVIVADYGHGMLTGDAIATLTERARFLAVNTQANAGNRGFNTIARYPRADYVCLAGHEVALETRMRHADQRDLVSEMTKHIDCKRFTVTLGKGGILHYSADSGFVEVPALAAHVVDRVGAGDAVLAITALLVQMGAPWEVIGLIGNVAGAQIVAELGNRTSIARGSLARHITSLLK